MGISIVVTSGKGGVGKTTSTSNIGISLAKLGKRVCLVDLDIGLRNLDAVMGLSDRVVYDVVDVAYGRASLNQALVRDARFDDSLYILAASQNDDKDILSGNKVSAIVDDLKRNFDFVLLDCPAGIEQGFQNAVAGADGALIITTPEISAVSDADRITGLLEEQNMEIGPHLVINRIRRDMIDDGTSMDLHQIVDYLSVPLIGVVVDENDVIYTSNNGDSVALHDDSLAGRCYNNIARRMLGESVPLISFDGTEEQVQKKSFWRRVFKK